MNIFERPRRLRSTQHIRDLVEENNLRAQDFVWPVFIKEGKGVREAISSLPGCYRFSVDELLKEVSQLLPLGLRALALFPCIEEGLKDSQAREALNTKGLVPRALKALRQHAPELLLIGDIALDPYSADGHDGIVKDGEILNDETLMVLGEQAEVQAAAGADFVAPSDMMDGRVGWIRSKLDEAGHQKTGIISYCAKYASGFYGPFRQALESTPRFGDKKTYQMNPMNRREALREARLDVSEGADILMVKPALAYLDVIHAVRQSCDLPIAAYNVSGEYAMVKAAASQGLVDERLITLEILSSIKRAGADLIFTYHTPDVLKWL